MTGIQNTHRLIIVSLTAGLILMTSNVKLLQAEQERICSVTSADLSKLTYNVFDQGLDSPLSWRCIANRGDFKEAQELINKYITVNEAGLKQFEIRNLSFHSGQLAAIDGRYKDAIEKFYRAIDDNNESASFLSWNEYVSGTIYFLQGNIKKLEQEIEKMETNNIENDAPNLQILKNFLRCPNDSYKDVYSRTSPCLNTH